MATERPVGVIGLGRLGWSLAHRLADRGIHVEAYDLDGEHRRAFAPRHPSIELAPSLTDLGLDCSIIVSALSDMTQLRAAAIGDTDRPGFALSLTPGSVVIHFGSGPYKDTLRMTGQLGNGGIGLIDVLACNAVDAEADQPIEMLVGGFPDLVERVRPVLDLLGHFTRVGPIGSATGLSALRSYVRAARLIALSEAMLIGRHAGIAPELLVRVFDGPIATGPECRVIASQSAAAVPHHDLATTYRAVADAVGFSEHIGISGDCVAFARDMLSDALAGAEGADESALLRHFTAMTADP